MCVCVCVCVCVRAFVCTVYLSPTGSMSLSMQLAYKQATVYLGMQKSLVKIGTYSSDLGRAQ